MSQFAKMQKESIYNPKFVSDLFDSMSSTYGLTNYISSFGFTERWRRHCIRKIEIEVHVKPLVFYDLMSGMGELWPSIRKSGISLKKINAVDISPKMNRIAKQNLSKVNQQVNVLQQDILNNNIESNSADCIVSSFGLKTFSNEQLAQLSKEIVRILKPGGSFSFVEISVPTNPFLKWPYLFYLKMLIPIVGFLFQGNSSDYKMLGIYTTAFGNCELFHDLLVKAGLTSSFQKLFFGCASIAWGTKSSSSTYSERQPVR